MSGLRELLQRLQIILVVLFTLSLSALALDEAKISETEGIAAAVRNELQSIEGAIQSAIITNDKLSEHRKALGKLRAKLQSAGATLDAPVQEIQQQIAKLPPLPAEGQTEAAEISAQRKLLTDMAGRLAGAQSQVKLLGVEVDQAEAKILAIQRDRFFQQVLEPSSSILSPSVWSNAASGLQQSISSISRHISEVGAAASGRVKWLQMGVVALAAFLLFLLALALQRVWRRRFLPAGLPGVEPDNLSRLWHAFWSVGTTFLLSWVAVIAMVILLDAAGLSFGSRSGVFVAIASFIVEVPATLVLIHRLAEPRRPAWRLLPIDSASASLFAIFAYCSAILAGLTSAMAELAQAASLPVDNSIAISAVTSLMMLGAMAVATLNLRDKASEEPASSPAKSYYNWALSFRLPVWLGIAVSGVALLLGYVALASYVLFNLFYTLLVIVIIFLIEYLAEAAARSAADSGSPLGSLVRRSTGFSSTSIERGGLLLRTTVDILLVVIGLPILIGLWAVNWIDFRSITNKIFFSFEVGNVTISPWTVVLVIGLLVFGISVTKLFAKWLDRRILTHAHLERGVQESVRTGITYAGYILAGGFALSAAGIDFSSLALIAGALGIGIGLGLQSVVHNFVSGIILLAERPVRVGDWIVTSAGEGLVKRINVRSTEIETFDGCSVIVPNSTLISEPVRNWTLGNTIGRVAVTVTVQYEQDAEAVRALLLKILTAHPKVLNFPEATVTLGKLTLYGVEFDMRGMVADVFEAVFVASDLRLSVLQEFTAKGIAIAQQPVPGAARAAS